jgi:S-DNA-T family DNA segregation ATPase FtsK/SpoIIIE
VVALQTAYVGGKVRRRDDAIVAVPLDEWRRPRFSDRERAEVGPTDLDRLVELIQVAADQSGAAAVRRRPWLDPLPVGIRLPEPIPVDVARTGLVSRDTSAADQARAPATVDIGIADHPEEQSQPRVQLDLTAGDSWLFAGAPRSGRTTALTTVAMQAAAAVPPQYLHIYGIEADGGLAGLADLPHCGTVARCDDPVVLDGLLRRLAQWVTQRQAQLVSDGFGSTAQAWRVGTRLPVSLLLLDGWEAFVAAADELDGGQSVATLIGLLRSGPAVGLTVVIAGGRGALSPRPAASVTRRYLLRLADRSDYGLAGLPAPLVPQRMPPGRAIQAPDGVEIQVAAGTANRPARRSGTGYGASRPTAGPPRCPKLPATAPRSSSGRYHSWFDLPISPASRERSPSA